ncbi:MAG: glycosyl transferase family 1 [Nitrospirales bacterium]|nr:MAG: glycosyl transferase family 1 [Nitrospirales bacterium]
MKVMHVVPSFGFGGMEKVLCSIINGLPSMYQHEILALDNRISANKWIKNPNVKILSFCKPKKNIKFFVALYKVLKISKPDILMTYNWGATDAVWLGRLVGISNIFHNEHGFNVDEAGRTQWKRNAVRFVVYRLARRVIVVSRELKEMMQCSFYLNGNHVVFIPNGLDFSIYSPDFNVRQKIRTNLGIRDCDTLVGFIGRLDAVKNLPLMLKAFVACIRKDPTFKLLIVGEGSERSHVEAICRDESIVQHVLLIGHNDDVLPYLRALDIFLLTSLREQMPMSLLEAMAVGVPIVASAVGEIPNMVEDGKEGFLCQPDDSAQEWATRLLLLADPQRQQVMSRAARRKVVKRFELRAMLSAYQKLFLHSERAVQ